MAATTNAFTVESADHFRSLLSEDLTRTSLINFSAAWAEPCKQMDQVASELARKYPQLLVLKVDAESQEDIAESFNVESVPTLLVLKGHTLLGRIAGADAAGLAELISKHVNPTSSVKPQSYTEQTPAAVSEKSESEEELNNRMRALMTQDKVVLFMKGSPDAPRCGFSRTIVKLLRDQEVPFSHFDILSDEKVRSGLKQLNDWPTFPQLIVKGEFVGGLDIVKEMVDNGEFEEVVKA